MERDRNHRRTYDARPYPSTFKYPAKVQHIANHGVSQREECNDDFRKARKPKIQIWEQKFLGNRVLRKHSRT